MENTRPVTEIFGENVFSIKTMRNYLSENAHASLTATICGGKSLDPSIADEVADAMKTWAIAVVTRRYLPRPSWRWVSTPNCGISPQRMTGGQQVLARLRMPAGRRVDLVDRAHGRRESRIVYG